MSLIEVFMTEKRVYKHYPQSFKEEAVALVTEQDYSVQQAADSLGIRSNILYRWKQPLEAQAQGEQLSEDEQSELNRLRKENKRQLIE